MKGASAEVAIWSFFSRQGLYFHHTKNQPPLRPPSTFSEHPSRFWPYLLSEKVMNFFCYKIWVIIFTKSAKLSDLGVPWVRNNRLLLDFVCTFKILLDTLTNSALALLCFPWCALQQCCNEAHICYHSDLFPILLFLSIPLFQQKTTNSCDFFK